LLVVLRLKRFDDGTTPEDGGKENRRDRPRRDGGDGDEEDDEDDDDRIKGDGKRRSGAAAAAAGVDEDTASAMRNAMRFNPLHRALSPLFTASSAAATAGAGAGAVADCVAFFAPAGTRVSAAVTTALGSWRAALRAHDIPDHRGSAGTKRSANNNRGNAAANTAAAAAAAPGAVPVGILRAFAAAVDAWSLAPADSSGATWGGLGALGASAEAAAGAMDDLVYVDDV